MGYKALQPLLALHMQHAQSFYISTPAFRSLQELLRLFKGLVEWSLQSGTPLESALLTA